MADSESLPRRRRPRRFFFLAPLLAVLAGSSSCATRRLEGDDSGRIYPTMRFVWDGEGDGTPTPRFPRSPLSTESGARAAGRSDNGHRRRRRRLAHGIEAAITGTRGDFHTVDFGRTDFEMVELMAAWRPSVRFDEHFDGAAFAGLGYHQLRTDFETTRPRTSHRVGPVVGAEAGFAPHEALRLYARASGHFLLVDSWSAQIETGVHVRFTDEIGLLAAYRYWSFDRESLNSLGSGREIEIDTQGFVIGMRIDW